MPDPKDIDGVLVQWGDRLFYLGNRIVKECRDPRLASRGLRARAAVIRQRIEATVIRRTTQVMAKVTGGGRGMKAIAAHFRYIGKKGRLDIEDEQGNVERGKNAVKELVKDWRFGGSFIAETSDRREAFNVMLSMPRGTDPLSLLRAARGGCPTRARGSQYVLVLHEHQANPHVHISVRAESKRGRRLNPRKADLHRWRETFALTLRNWGVDAEASRQATRGADRNYLSIWQTKAAARGDLGVPPRPRKEGPAVAATRRQAGIAWSRILEALRGSASDTDLRMAASVAAAAPRSKHSSLQRVDDDRRVGPASGTAERPRDR